MHRHSTKCLPSAGGNPEAAVASIHFTIGAEVQEAAARAELEAAGFHVIAFDDVHDVDEDLHWHEFSSSIIVVSGSGSFADEFGTVTEVTPGCRLVAEAGWLHRSLAGTATRVVLGTDIPFVEWSHPINKAPHGISSPAV